MRTLYRSLVTLHPSAFRRQFGEEMELIFDESGRPPRLLADISASLLRQWLLRSQLWVYALAAMGGTIPFALGFGFLSAELHWFGVQPHVRIHHAKVVAMSEPADAPFLILTTAIALMFISGIMTFAIAWFRYSQRRRQA
jgi:hypothetical protein